MTSDPQRSRAFYGELFGWTSESAGDEYGGYINFSRDGARVAGAMQSNPGQGPTDVWSIYLAVADAQATADAAAADGGAVLVPPMAVGPLGVMGMVSDAGGAAIGLWQPEEFNGFGVLGEDNAPSWFELHTRDYTASIAFYQKVFGWDTHTASDSDEFRYTTLGEGEAMMAGLMDAAAFLPEGVPAHWSVYFGVDDTDKALARIGELGGSVVQPAEDTPYGRLATAADPNGAVFKLVHMG
jgi:uncharacterized protein